MTDKPRKPARAVTDTGLSTGCNSFSATLVVGICPETIGAQVPSLSPVLSPEHASQVPLQSLSQQTPSTQEPE